MPKPINLVDKDLAVLVLKALADDHRLSILELLIAKPTTGMDVGTIAESLSASQPTTSMRLKQLRQAGLVSVQRKGKQRMYKFEVAGFDAVIDFYEVLRSKFGNTPKA